MVNLVTEFLLLLVCEGGQTGGFHSTYLKHDNDVPK